MDEAAEAVDFRYLASGELWSDHLSTICSFKIKVKENSPKAGAFLGQGHFRIFHGSFHCTSSGPRMFVDVTPSTKQCSRLMGGVQLHHHSSTAPSMDPYLSPLFPQSHGREKMFLPLNEMIVGVIYSCWSLRPSVGSVMIGRVTGDF